ncbi:MAG: RNB domain-containing ribonuclease [Desulfarculales bacterium]|jgi:exoribonuclease-2|nr:RNB domain-containing ribonuclease [Desulfarculales bacterium]
MLSAGYLIEFIDKNQITVAVVQSARKGRLAILTWQDKQMVLPENRVLWYGNSNLNPAAPRSQLASFLGDLEKQRRELAGRINVKELWELVREEGDLFTTAQLAELVFSPPLSPEMSSAVMRAIFDDRTYFRFTSLGYEPLSLEQIERKFAQKSREEEEKARREEFLRWLKTDSGSEAPAGLVDLLTGWVTHEDAFPAARQVKELISAAGMGGRGQVYDFLIQKGIFRPHEDLTARRENINETFSPEIVAEAGRIALIRPELPCLSGDFFTIDGADTRDFDDALSFIPRPDGGGSLGVHITSLSGLAPGTLIDAEAKQRGTTVYLPDRRIPMLPETLSENIFSLKAGEERAAVSYLADISPQGEIENFRIGENLFRVSRRLTYDEADERIARGDPLLSRMGELCARLRRQRARACYLPLPEVIIEVDENFKVEVKLIARDSPAREMVAETAILANHLHGRYMNANNRACLYRVQAAPKEPWHNSGPDELFANFSKKKFLQRVEISLQPGPHAGLGLDIYAQATSPLRRYLDLLAQRQLLAALRGESLPYGSEDLLTLARETESGLKSAARLRQERQRYWLLQWLRQKEGETVPALVLEQQARAWQILLTPIMFTASVPLQGISAKLIPGQEVAVKILRANPFEDILRLQLE